MTPIPLEDWPAIQALRSDALPACLVETPLAVPNKQLVANIAALLRRDFRFHSEARGQRGEDLDAAFTFRHDGVQDLAQLVQAPLGRLFDNCYAINGDVIAPRPEKLPALMAWARKLDPLCVIGAFLAERLRHGDINTASLRALIDAVRPLGPDHLHRETGLADNHVHLWGIFQPGYLLVKLLSLPQLPPSRRIAAMAERLPRLADFPSLEKGPLGRFELILYPFLNQLALEALTHGRTGQATAPRPKAAFSYHAARPLVKNLLRHMDKSSTPPDRTAVALLNLVTNYRRAGQYNRALLATYVFLHRLLACGDRLAARLAYLQLVLLNLLRAHMMMSEGVGLVRFDEFFLSPLRNPGLIGANTADIYRDIAATSFGSGVSDLDAKVSPGVVTPRGLSDLITNLDAAIGDVGGKAAGPHRYHFTVHFKRERDTQADRQLARRNGTLSPLPPRHAALRKRLEREASDLERFLTSPHARNWRDLRRQNVRQRRREDAQRIDLTRHVVALDIAGPEAATPPAVYAPVIRRLRGLNLRADRPPRHPRLRLSIHAGEDFSHLVTGLRRIDECLRHCEMTAGDRLGHALAMGLDPHDWLLRHTSHVLLPRGEHLDNCVWLWGQARELVSSGAHRFGAALPRLERDIERLSGTLYGESHPPMALLRAWEERWRPPPGRTTANATDRAAPLDATTEALLSCYHRSPKLRSEESKLECLDCNASSLSGADEQADLWEAVQDRLIERCMALGVAVEACPTSNLMVARLPSYADLPIFRWRPLNAVDLDKGERYNRHGLRSGPLACCVASDDGGLFSTTLPNEYAALRAAASSYTRDPARIESWLALIKSTSLSLFNTNHLFR